MEINTLPAIGSRWRWYNPTSRQVYTVIDVLVVEGSLEIRYRSADMTEQQYCQRSAESWYRLKNGQPRFIPLAN